MTKKKVATGVIFLLVMIVLIAVIISSQKSRLSAYVGTWGEIESYQYGELLSETPIEDTTFHLNIKEDGQWTITDAFDYPAKVTTGYIETYEGKYCIYYSDSFRYVLDKRGSKLVVDVEYLKGNHPQASMIFQKENNN